MVAHRTGVCPLSAMSEEKIAKISHRGSMLCKERGGTAVIKNRKCYAVGCSIKPAKFDPKKGE